MVRSQFHSAFFVFLHRKSIKKLLLKNLNSSQYSSSSSLNKESDDLASPSDYPQNGTRYRSKRCGPGPVTRAEPDTGPERLHCSFREELLLLSARRIQRIGGFVGVAKCSDQELKKTDSVLFFLFII